MKEIPQVVAILFSKVLFVKFIIFRLLKYNIANVCLSFSIIEIFLNILFSYFILISELVNRKLASVL